MRWAAYIAHMGENIVFWWEIQKERGHEKDPDVEGW
jgi:hypothetical protein